MNSEINILSWIKFGAFKYQKNRVIVDSYKDGMPHFLEIILILKYLNEYIFFCKIWVCEGFVDHFHSWYVEPIEKYEIRKINDLRGLVPSVINKSSKNGFNYIIHSDI